MKIFILGPYGSFGTNSYLLIGDNNDAAVIDAAGNTDRILEAAEQYKGNIKKILLTHGHCDHIIGLPELAARTGAQIYIHSADRAKLTDSSLNLTEYFGLEPIAPVTENITEINDGDIIPLSDENINVMHTPGHTSGSVVFHFDGIMFTGDTLFKGSIGRTDMPDGNSTLIRQSLKKIAEMQYGDKDFHIFAGHGEETWLKREKSDNPYLRPTDLYSY